MPYKHDYDRILTRLTAILSKLNDGDALSVIELAQEFGVSSRTIQRDFNERLNSFPIYQEKKKWKMQDGFRVEKSKSIEDELVLDIISKITESIGGNFATKSHTLLSKIKNEDFSPIYAKLNIEDISDKFSEIQLLEKAIKEKFIIQSTYDKENKQISTSTIKPLKIANFEGFWYLIALKGESLRSYYLKNISNIILSEEHFKSDTKLETLLDNAISIWFRKDVEPFEVKLFVKSHTARYFKRRPLPTQKIETVNSDGSMEFTIKITDEMEILPIIKYWIPHLYVVEPLWLQERVKQDLVKYLDNI